ncbi:hypothetical protein [Micromonospora sp. NPDC049891]|uniref:hypothetical protein n=1 Tax=Micromonospora sp. NPDC049891 TaxID=3155655 RepID=UPI0033EE8D7F
MLLSNPPPFRPIEVYTITPLDYLTAFGVAVALVVLAMAAVVWVMLPDTKAGGGEEPVESAETVELPRRNRPHSTGTVCAAGYRRETADDITTVIDTRQVPR